MAAPAVHVLSYLILREQKDAMREKVKYASLNSVRINFCVFHHVFYTLYTIQWINSHWVEAGLNEQRMGL